jgi:hypothetical protein
MKTSNMPNCKIFNIEIWLWYGINLYSNEAPNIFRVKLLLSNTFSSTTYIHMVTSYEDFFFGNANGKYLIKIKLLLCGMYYI